MDSDKEDDETNRRIDRLRDAVNRRLERLEDAQVETNRHLQNVDAKLGSVDTKLGSVDAKLGSVDAKLGSVDTGVQAIVGRLDRLVEATIRGSTAAADRHADHESRLCRLEKRVDDLEDGPRP